MYFPGLSGQAVFIIFIIKAPKDVHNGCHVLVEAK